MNLFGIKSGVNEIQHKKCIISGVTSSTKQRNSNCIRDFDNHFEHCWSWLDISTKHNHHDFGIFTVCRRGDCCDFQRHVGLGSFNTNSKENTLEFVNFDWYAFSVQKKKKKTTKLTPFKRLKKMFKLFGAMAVM